MHNLIDDASFAAGYEGDVRARPDTVLDLKQDVLEGLMETSYPIQRRVGIGQGATDAETESHPRRRMIV